MKIHQFRRFNTTLFYKIIFLIPLPTLCFIAPNYQPSFVVIHKNPISQKSSTYSLSSTIEEYLEGTEQSETPELKPQNKITGEYISQVCILPDKHKLVYDEYYTSNSTNVVVYLCNLAEGKDNPKSRSIFTFCQKTNKNFYVADWLGRGESSGKLMEATISRWTNDTIYFLDSIVSNDQTVVLVGSGIGAWVAFLIALKRPDLVDGIVGLSADPDFTEDLLWKELPESEKNAIMNRGYKDIKWGGRNAIYPITSTLIEDARDNLILRGGSKSLDITCPVRLIHSLEDEEVPTSVPLRLADCIKTDDVEIIFPKVGGHNLRDVSRFTTIQRLLYRCIYQCFDSNE